MGAARDDPAGARVIPRTCVVYGQPRPKGSLRFLAHRSTGRPVPVGRNRDQEQWAALVAVHVGGLGWTPVAGPVAVDLTFRLERPAGHYGTGRNREQIRADAPAWPSVGRVADVDKLARSVLDALTGLAYLDDRQVVSLIATKTWGARAGVEIRVREAP